MKLFNIEFPSYSGCSDFDSYLRLVKGAVNILTNSISLSAYSVVTTDTYHNIIPSAKLLKYTKYFDYYFEITGKGEVVIETIGINSGDFYNYEFLISKNIINLSNVSEKISINKELFKKADAVFFRIIANTDSKISEFTIGAEIDKVNKVNIAYCICSYNREEFIRRFVKEISSKTTELPISYYMALNGDEYNIEYSKNFKTYKNRNLGGCGGFTRCLIEAKKQAQYTHYILADDDIEININAIFKTVSILRGIKPEYSDYFISGAMLSIDEPWLQYERVATLSSSGFTHFGGGQDTRDKNVVLENTLAEPMIGLAGWWFCVIPDKVLNEFKLPAPIFVRGDDVEYSYRCHRKILTINGICVWHVPFVKKYSEIMEDYYLVRNMLMLNLRYNQSLPDLKRIFFDKKFKTNILMFDYVAAKLNLIAMRDVLNKEYWTDPEINHKRISSIARELLNNVPTWEGSRIRVSKLTSVRNLKRTRRLISQYLFGYSKDELFTGGGFVRESSRFIGKKSAIVYQGEGIYRRYSYNAKEARKLLFEFMKLKRQFEINKRDVMSDLSEFFKTKTNKESWDELFS